MKSKFILIDNKNYEILPGEIKSWKARSEHTKRIFIPDFLFAQLEKKQNELELLNKAQVISWLFEQQKEVNK